MEAAIPRSWRPGIVVITRESLRAMPAVEASEFGRSLDEMGVRSAKAQGLSKPITTYTQMRTCDNRLYAAVERGSLRGILRVGKRQLFVRRKPDSDYVQIHLECVLDFYVHESCQRSGEGSQLFNFMLQHEGLVPHMLGYDRPSPKLISFMRKHHGLKSFVPQANHFVIFDDYWKGGKARGAATVPAVPRRPRPAAAADALGDAGGSNRGASGDGGARQFVRPNPISASVADAPRGAVPPPPRGLPEQPPAAAADAADAAGAYSGRSVARLRQEVSASLGPSLAPALAQENIGLVSQPANNAKLAGGHVAAAALVGQQYGIGGPLGQLVPPSCAVKLGGQSTPLPERDFFLARNNYRRDQASRLLSRPF